MEERPKVKPSERFANLFNAVVEMEDGQDRNDLLSLFHEADRLYLVVSEFDKVVEKLRFNNRQHGKIAEDHKKWVCKQMAMLEVIFDAREKEKEKLRIIK